MRIERLGLRYAYLNVSGVLLGLMLAASVWAADDSYRAQVRGEGYEGSYSGLDIRLEAPAWTRPRNPVPCTGACLARGVDNVRGASDEATVYDRDFSLHLGQSGPVSFHLSGRRLGMELAF